MQAAEDGTGQSAVTRWFLRHRRVPVVRFRLALALTAMGITWALSGPLAEAASAAGPAPSPVMGNLLDHTTSVPFEVPAFHGIEPNLGLAYSSSRGNGLAGVGWSLTGIDQVDRVSPGRGAPRLDASDVFLLDGEELVPDTSLGGEYVTKRQRFLRIGYDASADAWSYTTPAGTRATLAQTAGPGSMPSRWLLTSVTDPHGNTVRYSYSCDGGQCYPSRITYAGAEIKLFYEPRPDVQTEAAGGLRFTDQRLKTVAVYAAGQLARAYRLGYETSPVTDRSLLTSLVQYGSNAAIDADGDIGSGARLPATTFAYQHDRLGFPDDRRGPAGFCGYEREAGVQGPVTSPLLAGDVNGDGRADLICPQKDADTSTRTLRVALATNTGFGGYSVWRSSWCFRGDIRLADVDGDGSEDAVCLVNSEASVALSDGRSAFTGGALWWRQPACDREVMLADVNGDGRSDAVCDGPDAVGNRMVYVGLSNGSSAFVGAGLWKGSWCNKGNVSLADVNGDGRSDAVCSARDFYSNRYLIVAISDGSHQFVGAGTWRAGWCNKGEVSYADVNGDGSADAVCSTVDAPTSAHTVQVGISDGHSEFSGGGAWASGWCYQDGDVIMADVNGDRRADAVCAVASGYPGKVSVALSDGSSAFSAAGLWEDSSGCTYSSSYRLADYNGDGRADLACITGGDDVFSALSGTQALANDLLTQERDPGGAVSSVDYEMATAPGGPARARVARITADPGVGPSLITDISASGPAWDPRERRFLGFRSVSASNAAGGSTTEFWQAAGYPANRPRTMTITNPAGSVLSRTTIAYKDTAAGGVYTSLPEQVIAAVCSGSSLCQQASTTYTYDRYGNVVSQLDSGGEAGRALFTTTTFRPNTADYMVAYPAAQQIYGGTSSEAPKLEDVRFVYDGQASFTDPPVRGDVTKASTWLDTTGQLLTQTLSYDAVGNLTSSTDALGHTSRMTYDASRLFPVRACDALSHCLGAEWDKSQGVPTSVVDEANPGTPTTTFSYDAFGRPTRQRLPDGATTTISYVDIGNPASQYVQTAVSDGTADGLWERSYVDGLGRPYMTVRESGATVKEIYDAQGALAYESAPYLPPDPPRYTRFDYDPLGRATAITAPDGAAYTTAYAVVQNDADADYAVPRLTRTSCDPGGYCVREGMNADGEPVAVNQKTADGWYGQRVRIAYDRLGRMTGYAQGDIEARVSYDSLGRKTAMVDPDAGRWSYGYDAVGNLTSQTDARGVTVGLTYDALNRLTRVASGGRTLAAYTYDEASGSQTQGVGRLTSMRNPSGSATFGYDVDGRLVRSTKVIGGESFSTGLDYDAAGRLASLTYPDGEVVRYGYDTTGCLQRVGNYVTDASCTANGSPAEVKFGNGLVETLTYSAARQWLTGITFKQGASTVLSFDTRNRNPRGQLLAQGSSEPDLRWQYDYDALGRLTEATNAANPDWSQSFSYDQFGRVYPGAGGERLTYPAPGHAHAPATHDGTAYTYDENGNRTGGDGRSYSYDELGRMTRASGTAYSYDGLGDLVQVGDTRLLGLDGQVLMDAAAEGGSKSKYYYFGGLRIARKNQAGATRYYLNDRLGSAVGLSTPVGDTDGQAVYRPYGQRVKQTGIADAFGLAGERLDPSGLYDMGARKLDPSSATWTSPDPSGLSVDPSRPQTLNRYAYAGNDPVNATDPSGFMPVEGGTLPPIEIDSSEPWRDLWFYNGLQGRGLFIPPGIGVFAPSASWGALFPNQQPFHADNADAIEPVSLLDMAAIGGGVTGLARAAGTLVARGLARLAGSSLGREAFETLLDMAPKSYLPSGGVRSIGSDVLLPGLPESALRDATFDPVSGRQYASRFYELIQAMNEGQDVRFWSTWVGGREFVNAGIFREELTESGGIRAVLDHMHSYVPNVSRGDVGAREVMGVARQIFGEMEAAGYDEGQIIATRAAEKGGSTSLDGRPVDILRRFRRP